MAITIYALWCRPNGFRYVGSTKNVRKRYREHRCLLRNGKHQEPDLQADWDKYGETSFDMIELASLPSDSDITEKRDAELFWMKAHQPKLYNRNIVAYGPTEETLKRGQSQVARRKAGKTMRGKPKPPGFGARVSATKKRLGQRPSPEAVKAGNRKTLFKRYGWVEKDNDIV